MNKTGGPDKRFNNNRQLPILRYETIDLASDTGLRARIEVSKVGNGPAFRAALHSLGAPMPR